MLRIRRCLVVGVALAGYAIAAIGFPLPAAVRDVSRPYPCQDHSCGCMNAEQCWRSCCCYSAEEKVAWARSHHVEAPAEVIAEAEAGWRTPRLRDQQKAPATERCCCCAHEKAPAAKAPPARKVHWVDGISARHCRGLGRDWLSGPVAAPPAAPVSWTFEWLPAGWLPSADIHAIALPSLPLAPPPRA
jgi:hypothetical protein